MDISTINSLIGSLGFPIACCVALFVRMNKQDEAHKEETDALKEAINNNTLALVRLSAELSTRKDDE